MNNVKDDDRRASLMNYREIINSVWMSVDVVVYIVTTSLDIKAWNGLGV